MGDGGTDIDQCSLNRPTTAIHDGSQPALYGQMTLTESGRGMLGSCQEPKDFVLPVLWMTPGTLRDPKVKRPIRKMGSG